MMVVDSSVALAWGLPDEANPYADAALGELPRKSVLVPALWATEIANGLATAERRGRCTKNDCERFLELMTALPIMQDVQPLNTATARAYSTARKYGLTAYDAAYLELAAREGALLASLDKDLVKAAHKAGVKVYQQ